MVILGMILLVIVGYLGNQGLNQLEYLFRVYQLQADLVIWHPSLWKWSFRFSVAALFFGLMALVRVPDQSSEEVD